MFLAHTLSTATIREFSHWNVIADWRGIKSVVPLWARVPKQLWIGTPIHETVWLASSLDPYQKWMFFLRPCSTWKLPWQCIHHVLGGGHDLSAYVSPTQPLLFYIRSKKRMALKIMLQYSFNIISAQKPVTVLHSITKLNLQECCSIFNYNLQESDQWGERNNLARGQQAGNEILILYYNAFDQIITNCHVSHADNKL